jgi:hypothetical protein
MKKALSVLLAVILCFSLVPATAGASAQTFTLMVYLCGTDLESDGGLATADLKEMTGSDIAANSGLTLYVQTGGTKNWENKKLADGKGERWRVDKTGLTKLTSLGDIDMGDEAEFASFLQYGFENFPADRYGLIFWDHGSGATDGVCYDEMTDNSLNMAEIYTALATAAKEPNYRKFSMVGFDACLMADYEMAVHLQPFADYMIASEETEPGEGWNYKSWLPALSKNPGVDIPTLGKTIVDGFLQSVKDVGYDEFGTLSVLDLNKLDALHSALEAMGDHLNGQIATGNFNDISRIRQNVRSFGETDDDASDMIDLGVFADVYKTIDATDAAALTKALGDVVVYSGFTSNLSGISGLAVLVPYSTRADAPTYLQNYDTQNLMPKYTAFIRSLVSGMADGSHTFSSSAVSQQSVQDATVSWFSQYATDTDSYYEAYSNLWSDWSAKDDSTTGTGEGTASVDSVLGSLYGDNGQIFNSSAYDESTQQTVETGDNVSSDTFADLWDESTQTDNSDTVAISVDGQTYDVQNPFAQAQGANAYTVNLTQEDMRYLASADACLMMDASDPDFECYVDLGYTQDVVIDWNNGKLYGLFDGTWPTLDGQMVCIYDQIANDNYVRSLIPVTLNGEETYLLVVFDAERPGGVVVGYTEGFTDSGMAERGYQTLKQGDVVVPQYELIYWDSNDDEQSEPFEGDPITVGEGGSIAFGYDDVETDADYMYGFCLNDVYGGYQYTDFTTLSY